MKFFSLIALFLLLLLPGGAIKAEGKISGVVFGDAAWIANHRTGPAGLENETAFWIRRGYFTYDNIFTEQVVGRFRLEFVSPDLDDATDVMRPFVKEASLKWKPNDHTLSVGLIPTPTWVDGVVESHWGYRSVEKTPIDLQGFGNAVDLGVGAKGTFGEEKRLGYVVVAGNGSGTRSESNGQKKVYASFFVKPFADWVVETYGDYEAGTGHTARYMGQGFIGYSKATWRVGSLFAYHVTQLAAGGRRDFRIFSVHGAAKLSEKLWSFARFDRTFNANINGNNIAYLPFHNQAESNFTVAGLDFEPTKNIHLLPNVETIFYTKVDGSRPGPDVVPRLTFAWNY